MYDQVPWGEQGAFSSGLDAILGIARLYGAGGNVRDVLDLGCGGGGTLLQIADDVPGRLVGVDLSPQSCELARAQLAPHGDRARIICGDLLSLEPEDLGQFDMIYLVGVLYILPPSEHQALLDLAARCLRPGGLLIVSYYNGGTAVVRASIYNSLRIEAGEPGDLTETIGRYRSLLGDLRDSIQGDSAVEAMVRLAIHEVETMEDDAIYHEAFSPHFQALQTVQVNEALRSHDIRFLTSTIVTTASTLATSARRALIDDRNGLIASGYEYAFFGRVADGPPDATAWNIRWSSHLKRSEDPSQLAGHGRFNLQPGGNPFEIEAPLTQRMLDALADAPMTFQEALRIACKDVEATDEEVIRAANDFLVLWQLGAIRPLAV